MAYDPYKALYLHIPFCKSRCVYCDFTTTAAESSEPRVQEYVDHLILDLRRASKEEKLGALETIYIGGGTPSHLSSGQLTSLLYGLSLSTDLTKEGLEFSMEANPESLNERLVADIWALGVNRLSLGVQSFSDSLLKFLGRPHSSADALRAIDTASSRFDNLSVDLMAAIPGQTEEDLIQSLEVAVEAGVKHISVYPLTVEPHTPLDTMVLQGLVKQPDEDSSARFMEIAEAYLRAQGFHRYEVASYAKPGYECAHNKAYWTGIPYLGLGTSAVTMTQNDTRRMRVQDGKVIDDLNRKEREAEDLMLAMRLTEGITEGALKAASVYLPKAPEVMETLIDDDLVIHENGRFYPSAKGWLLGNELYGRLLDLGAS